MSLWVDVKYANMLASHLRNFKRKSDYLWNYSCCVCGDSSKNKLKARGYIYKTKTGLACKCHNCGYSASLGNLIKHVDPNLYREYALENYKESGAPHTPHANKDDAIPSIIKPVELSDAVLDPLKRLDKLSLDHPAVKYIVKRKIPSKHWHLLYFCTRWKHFVNSVVPNKFKSMEGEHPRLIIPFFNSHGKCFAFQGRAFGPEEPRYMTIKVDETEEKIFGLERLNYSKRVYITEGPLDSLFIPNAIAVSGSSSFNTPSIKALKTNATVIYDNERRSPELLKLMGKTIDEGYSICLWPETIEQKDVNDMILAGRTPEELVSIINENTYTGIEAQLQFAHWRKR